MTYFETANVATLNATAQSSFHIPVHEQIALLTDVRDGNDEQAGEAFGVLVTHYRPAMVSLAESLTEGNASGEDIVQDILIEIYEARDRISTTGRFWALIRTCIARRASNERRNTARRATDSLDAFVGFDDEGELRTMDDAHPQAVMDSTTPESMMCEKETALRVRELVGKLKERHQTILRLKYMEERSDADIAEIMGLSGVPRAKSLAYEARGKLRDLVLQQAPDLADSFDV